MNDAKNASLGVIEGFFGRSWSWEDRADMALFLHKHNYNFYIYAPKSDVHLRKHWQEDWPSRDFNALLKLREVYRQQEIRFGVGFSPLNICSDFNRGVEIDFINKIKQLNGLSPDILCLLFDDMRGDLPQLAETQTLLMKLAQEYTTADHIIMCPTYYSDDPVLERVFGTQPKGYLEALGKALDPAIDIFWTGTQVCSESFTTKHLQDVAQRLNRKPFLWDNYPVNDSAEKSQYLHLRPFSKDRALLAPFLAGHAVNPMNQAKLSRIALASLPIAYQQGQEYNPELALPNLLKAEYSSALAQTILADLPQLQDGGLKTMKEEGRQKLIERYRGLSENTNAACEIVDWLEGSYAFDPNCLTD